MFPVNGNHPLVSLVDDGRGLSTDLIHRKHVAFFLLILGTETAVFTTVHTNIRQVKRREEHNPVIVHLPLHLQSGFPHFLQQFRILHVQQQSRFRRGENLDIQRFLQYIAYLLLIGVLLFLQFLVNLPLVNKIFSPDQVFIYFVLLDDSSRPIFSIHYHSDIIIIDCFKGRISSIKKKYLPYTYFQSRDKRNRYSLIPITPSP